MWASLQHEQGASYDSPVVGQAEEDDPAVEASCEEYNVQESSKLLCHCCCHLCSPRKIAD